MEWNTDDVVLPQNTSGMEASVKSASCNIKDLDTQIKACGDKLRKLKAEKADKVEIDSAVIELLALKASFKTAAGFEWGPKISIEQTSAEPIEDPTVTALLESSRSNYCLNCLSKYNTAERTAKFILCFHTFCLQCLKSLSSLGVIIECPLCHETFACNYGVENLPSNLYAMHVAGRFSTIEEERTMLREVIAKYCTVRNKSEANLSCDVGMEGNPDVVLPQKTSETEASAESSCNINKDLDTQIKSCGGNLKKLNLAEKADQVGIDSAVDEH